MNDLLAKPFTKGELYNCLKKWLKNPDSDVPMADAPTLGDIMSRTSLLSLMDM